MSEAREKLQGEILDQLVGGGGSYRFEEQDEAELRALTSQDYLWLDAGALTAEHETLLRGFLSPQFLTALQGGYRGYFDALDAAMAASHPDWTGDDQTCSGRTRALKWAITHKAKPYLDPFTGALAVTDRSLGKDWYLHRDGDRLALLSEWSETMIYLLTDCLWVFPKEKIALYVFAGYRLPALQNFLFLQYRRMAKAGAAVGAHLQRPSSALTLAVSDFWCPHIGHYIWNVLTGWDRLLDRIDPDQIGQVLLYEGQDFFAPLPALLGPNWPKAPVSRLWGEEPIFVETLERGYFILTIKDENISDALADRVVEATVRQCTPEFIESASAFVATHDPVIICTLRLENREWLNQAEGWPVFMAAVLQRHPRAGFLLDGMNSDTTKGWTTTLMSLEAEVALAEQVAAAAPTADTIRTAVGRPLCESMWWYAHADFFAAPQGSGLALVKWLTNVPGVAFGNFAALTATWDQKSYASLKVWDRFRPNLHQAVYISTDLIRDEPMAGRAPSAANYHMKGEDLASTVVDALALHGLPRRLASQ